MKNNLFSGASFFFFFFLSRADSSLFLMHMKIGLSISQTSIKWRRNCVRERIHWSCNDILIICYLLLILNKLMILIRTYCVCTLFALTYSESWNSQIVFARNFNKNSSEYFVKFRKQGHLINLMSYSIVHINQHTT